jgi:hypothetical protein
MAMAKQNLKQLAEELESLIAAPRTVAAAPVIDESYLIAAEPTVVPEAAPTNEHLIPQLVRSVVDYTLSRAPEGASPQNIGEAITAGVNEAIKHLGLDRAKVVEAVDLFFSELSESVYDSLVE